MNHLLSGRPSWGEDGAAPSRFVIVGLAVVTGEADYNPPPLPPETLEIQTVRTTLGPQS